MAAASYARVVPLELDGGSPAQIAATPWPVNQPIRLCALLVEFQPDSIAGTTGDGSFNSGLPDTLLVDPIPHDRAYFEDHLAYLSNYYGFVSKGAVSFERMDIFPLSGDPYRLPYPMWHYNYNADTALLNQRLVELFVQAATLSEGDVDFSQYDAVVVIHAGVGKDFNIGYDPTPFDIPSAYISEGDLQRYEGTIPSGLTRGLLIPECQNQQETLELGIELSLNGVFIKLFGNWLGLPDLYNTQTGASGVGRFGMMDQGSGNVNALVPCIPDAWTRVFMGWETASTTRLAGAGDTVRVSRFNVDGAPEIVKIPITPVEYYLMENRDSDQDSIGHVTLYDRYGHQMVIDHDGDISIEPGFTTAVRASRYDFGIPGSGLLIWRIDERIIQRNYESNSINADPQNKGVELAEADGSRDIGREFGFATAGSGTELGIAEDCWYRDNRAYRDANGGTVIVRFNDNTRPSARLKDHSFTFLELSDFSDVDSIMSVKVKLPLVQPGFPVTLSGYAQWAIADLDGDGARESYFLRADSLFVVSDSTGLRFAIGVPDSVRLFTEDGPYDLNQDGRDELWFDHAYLGRVTFESENFNLVFVAPPQGSVGTEMLLKPCTNEAGVARLVVASWFSGHSETVIHPDESLVYDYDLNLLHAGSGTLSSYSGVINAGLYPTNKLLYFGLIGTALCSVSDSLELVWTRSETVDAITPTILLEPTRTSVYLGSEGYLDLADGSVLCGPGQCNPPLEDWDRDGIADGGGPDGLLSPVREDIHEFSKDDSRVIDLDANGDADLYTVISWKGYSQEDSISGHSQISCYQQDGHLFASSPWSLPGFTNYPNRVSADENSLFVMCTGGTQLREFWLMRLPIVATTQVRQDFWRPSNVLVVGPRAPQAIDRGDEFAYAWPNPASAVSNVRVTLPFAAHIECNVYDLAGREIAALRQTTPSQGATEIPWDVTHVSSGVYIARVVAKGGGDERACEIKIAVVK